MLTPQKSISTAALPGLNFNGILNEKPEKDFEGLLDIATAITGSPSAYLILRQDNSFWMTAKNGLTLELQNLQNTFCGKVLDTGQTLIIPDAQSEPEYACHELVVEAPFIRFYAGFPLISEEGDLLGVLSMVDSASKELNRHQQDCIYTLCGQILRVLELRKKNELLELLNERVENKNGSLDKLLQHQEKVMAILGHDTRGPLVFIKEMLLMIKDNKISVAEAQELFGIIDNQIGCTLSLIDNLTTWGIARIGENNLPADAFDAHDIVNKAFQPHRLAAAKKGITFCNEIKKGRLKTNHKETLTFIIRNLLNNAVKYTEAGCITVRGRKKKKYFEICVTDTGIGMPESMLDYLFITKFDSRAGTRGEQGSGLGLMLIFDFVEQLEGYIEAESKEGIGTTFRIGIPLENTISRLP